MKIECKLKREGGSHIDFGSVVYHFAPDKNGSHVAEVTDKDHIGRLLSINEAYQIADDDAPAPKTKSVPVKEESQKAESDTGGDDDTGDDEGGESDEEAQAAATVRAGLVADYLKAFGKNPHHKLTDDSIRAKLAEKSAE